MAMAMASRLRHGTDFSDSEPSSTSVSRSSSQSSHDSSSATSAQSIDIEPPTRADDPTTIVGLACRLPGAQSPSTLWENLVKQRDLQRKIPENRFNVDAFYHPEGAHKGTVCQSPTAIEKKIAILTPITVQCYCWVLPRSRYQCFRS